LCQKSVSKWEIVMLWSLIIALMIVALRRVITWINLRDRLLWGLEASPEGSGAEPLKENYFEKSLL